MQTPKLEHPRRQSRSRQSASVPIAGAIEGIDRRSALRFIMAMFAGTVAGVLRPRSGWSQATVNNHELSPGVIVDLDRNQAYVSLPEGGIAAVDLARGNEVWRSKEAAKPLSVAGDLLVSQGEPRRDANLLRIVTLDIPGGGRVALERSVELPANVKTAPAKSRASSFTAAARIVAGNLAVSWQYESIERPLQGVAPEGGGDAPPDPRARARRRNETRVSNGAFRLDLQSGDVTGRQLNVPFTPPQAGRAVDLRGAARIAGLPETQFLSTDGGYVLSPERVADGAFERYRWTIYDRSTAERVGEFRTHVRYTPFVVADSRLIYEVPAYSVQTATGIVDEPFQIRAMDLRTGAVLWRQPVRDFAQVESLPP
jgi:hypothetical protein